MIRSRRLGVPGAHSQICRGIKSRLYSIFINTANTDYESALTTLWEFGTSGIVEDARGVRGFFNNLEEAKAAAAGVGLSVVNLREETSWISPSPEQGCDPILVGERFYIAPSDSPAAEPGRRIRLSADAKSAFGSGRHESTQLILQALERCPLNRMTVLDVGCGSGILSAAAHLLSAQRVFACDIDPNAISVARSIGNVPIFAGSVDAVRTSAADLVLANISANIIDALAPDLHRVAKPDAQIIIAGFIRAQVPQRWNPVRILEADEWQCWICGRDPVLAEESSPPRSHPRQWW